MASRVSMEDIAKELGISKNTVSLVFRNIPGVNEQTRMRVLEAASRLGYIYPKESPAKSEAAAPASICIVIPSSARDSAGFFSQIQFGIEGEARKNRINTIVAYYDDRNREDIPLSIKEGNVSGIITLGRVKKPVFDSLNQFGLPLVMVDHYFESMAWNYVLSDNFTGGFTAGQYLMAKNHKKIGFLGDIQKSVSFYDRFVGFKKALEQSSLRLEENHFIHKSFEAMAEQDATLVSKELASRHELPTAFFCCNDIEAITLIKGLSAIGLRVPQDISVMGFDDIHLARNFTPELTTVRVSNELMGVKAVRKLIQTIEKPEPIKEKLVLGVSLIERESVKNLENG